MAAASHPLIDLSPRPVGRQGNARLVSPRAIAAGEPTAARPTANEDPADRALPAGPPGMDILLVTEPGLFADGLTHCLSSIDAAAKVSICATYEQAIKAVRPRLIVLDVDVATEEPAALVARFVARFASLPVVALGATLDESLMAKVLHAGAKTYLPKTYNESQALGVLRVVLAETAVPAEAEQPPAPQANPAGSKTNGKSKAPYGLTRAELEILSLLCEGLPSFEIAKQRGGTEGTVKAHLYSIYRKLGVENRAQAIRIAQRLDDVRQLELERAENKASVRDWLLPHMQHEFKRQGELLFNKGDPGRTLYFIQKGRIALPEIGVEMNDGELFGEIGIFTPEHARTCSARCETDAKLFCLSAERAKRLFFEHPQFAYHVTQLIARRLQADSKRSR